MRVKFRVIGAFMFLGLVLLVTGCAVKGEEQVLITVDPESAVVTLGSTKQFESSPTDVTVTWSVDGILWGNEGTVGKIDSTGLYTAQYTAPSDPAKAPEKVSIEATDPSGTAAAGTATAFLTTFKANREVSTPYNESTYRVNTYSSGQRSIAVYNDGTNVNVYTVWADDSMVLSQAWFVRSTNGGNTFDSPIRVDEAGLFALQVFPAIAVDSNGNVFIAWEDHEENDADIFIKKYDGLGFGPRRKVNLDLGGFSDYDSSPSIAANGSDEVYVVWEYRDNSLDLYPDIYFARSIDAGQTFSRALIALNGRRPAIAIDSSGVAYVVWEDLTEFSLSRPTHIKICKIEGDNPPSTPVQIDSLSSPYHARFPSIAVGPGDTGERVYVIWQSARIPVPGFSGEGISSYDIDLAVLDRDTLEVVDTPTSFPDNLNAGFFGGPAYPSITADSDYIYAVWDDLRNETKDIYFSKSLDGVIFTTNRIVNDSTGGEWQWHEKPSIAASEGKAYVIWTDSRNISIDPAICPTGDPDICPNDVFFTREE